MRGRQQVRREPSLNIEVEHHEALIDHLKTTSGDERRELLYQFVEDLPRSEDFNFILALTYLVEQCITGKTNGEWFIDELNSILEDPPDTINRDSTFVRFAAFHTLTIHSYSTENITEWGTRHEKFGHYFRESEYRSMYEFDYSMQQYYTDQVGNIEEARRRLQQLVNGPLQENPGVLNAYVSCTLRAIEKRVNIDEKTLKEVEEIIEHAIDLYPFSEYFLNQGRIKAELGEYETGIERIREGMDREDATNYSKLAEYRQWINNLKYRHQSERIEERINELDGQINNLVSDLRSDTVQFLAFFSAIITFIVTTVQFAINTATVTQAAALITMMSGCLVIAFSAFRFMFDEPWDRPATVMLVWSIGFVLIGLSGLIYIFL